MVQEESEKPASEPCLPFTSPGQGHRTAVKVTASGWPVLPRGGGRNGPDIVHVATKTCPRVNGHPAIL